MWEYYVLTGEARWHDRNWLNDWCLNGLRQDCVDKYIDTRREDYLGPRYLEFREIPLREKTIFYGRLVDDRRVVGPCEVAYQMYALDGGFATLVVRPEQVTPLLPPTRNTHVIRELKASLSIHRSEF